MRAQTSQAWSEGRTVGVRQLAVLALLFVVVRVVALVAAPLPVLNYEELDKGLVARELLIGPAFPLFDYQYDPFGGGTLVIGIAAVPFFAVMGARHVALKVLAIVWSLVAFVVWVYVLRRALGPRATLAACLMWVFAPLPFVRLSLTAWGNHGETLLFAGLCLLLWLSRDVDSEQPWRWFAIGLVAGFAIYFCYTSLLFVAALAVTVLVTRPRPSLRALVASAIGAAMGFAPWLAYNVPRDFSGLVIHGHGLSNALIPTDAGAPLRRLWSLASQLLPQSLAPPPELGVLCRLGGVAMLALIGVGVVASVIDVVGPRQRGRQGVAAHSLRVFSLVYAVVFAAAYAVSRFGEWHDYHSLYTFRYLAPLLPCLVVWFGVAVERWPRFGWASVVPVGLCFSSLVSILYADGPRSLQWLDYQGYSYRALCHRRDATTGTFATQVARAAAIRDPASRELCVTTRVCAEVRQRLGGVRAEQVVTLSDAADVRAWASGLDPALDAIAQSCIAQDLEYRALTSQLELLPLERWQGEAEAPAVELAVLQRCARATPQSVAAWIATLRPQLRDSAWEALGRCLRRVEDVASLGELTDDTALAAVYRGLGRASSWRTDLEPWGMPSLDPVPERFRRAYESGVVARLHIVCAEYPRRREDLSRWWLERVGLGAERGARSAR